jgi:hypothetical protein
MGVRPVRPPGKQPSALAQTARLLSGLYFLAMALGVNALYLLRHPEQYDGIADLALLPPIEWLTRAVVRPLATPFTLLLIAFELTVALLILGKGRAVPLGLAAAIIFQLAVILAVGAYGLVNLPVIAVQALLLRSTFDRSALDLVRGGVAATLRTARRPGTGRYR